MSSDGDDISGASFDPLPARRALSFDEFKVLYQNQKQADLARLRDTGRTGPWLSEMRQRRDIALGADQKQEGGVRAGPSPSTVAAPGHHRPAQPPHPPQRESLLTVVSQACLAAVVRIGQFVNNHWLLLLQISITSVAMFGSVSWQNVLFTMSIFAVLHAIKWVVSGWRVERPGRVAGAGPTPVGRLFLRLGAPATPTPVGQVPPPVPPLCRIGYMLVKCMETFALSLWPNYSLESLEAQLQRDGIVRARPVVAGAPAVVGTTAPTEETARPPSPQPAARVELVEDANPPAATPRLQEIE